MGLSFHFWHTIVSPIQHNWLILFLVVFVIAQYFISIKVRKLLAQKYKYTGFADQGDESYMMYYKKLQHFELVRFLVLFAVVMYTLATYQSGIFSVLAVALGAVILTFQSLVLSFGIYFYLVSQYRVGDTIRIGTLRQGEIMYLEPLYMGLASKNNDGDHTGELFIIPNNLVWMNSVTKVKLSLHDYTKQIIRIAYDMKVAPMSFEEFVAQLEQFLSDYLPPLEQKAYYNYQSYIGFRYKLDFEAGEFKDGRQVMYIDIGFLTRLIDAAGHKKAIIAFTDHILYHIS